MNVSYDFTLSFISYRDWNEFTRMFNNYDQYSLI